MDTPGSSNPSILNPVAESSTRNQRQPQQPNHRRKPRPNPTEGPAGVSDRPASDTSKPPPRRRPPRRDNKPQDGGNGSENSKANERGAGNGRRPPKPRPQNTDKQEKAEPSVPRPPGQGRRKGIKFGGQLTSSNEANSEASDTHQSTSKPRRERYRRDPDPQEDDLTSNLIRSLRNPPYADCPICFNSIHPPQPTWSCSPLTPIVAEEKAGETSHEDHEPQYCWTTFHLKCIKSWSEKSYNDVKAAWAARGEEGRGGEWRCPGCQGRRNTLTRGYWCFCGSTSHPNNRLATPHSCGNPCSRPRTSCSHPCSLLCHPGPCPPCKVSLEIVCGCIRKRVLVVKCGDNKDQHGRTKGAVVSSSSCGATCSKTLNCGKHQCQRVCHLGDCAPCEEREVLHCWCGQHDREGRCGEGDIWEGERAGCSDENLSISKILRGFNCGNSCGKLYDCGTHHCEKPCHPSSDDDPRHCPLSPDRVHTCPCGKKAIASSTESDGAFPPRQKCTDPVPTCGSPCHKLHTRDGILQCDHPCQSPCHSGPCPPCSVEILRPCRCGSTTKKVMCGDLWPSKGPEGKEGEVLCDKPCMGLRACGRHQCNRLCCPMASFAAPTKGKGKKKTGMNEDVLDEALKALHECDLVCGKTLTCGNHHCEERDHKGPCKPCLRSSFEELICACGRTVLEPPVACGTKVQCPFPCSKPPPPCGHQKAPHACHSEDVACPPCPFLTSKICACGKKEIGNVKCSLVREKVSCGTQCGKLMGCGFHRCDRLCHAGDCGDCTSMCGKARKLCLPEQHPCTSLCHAPAVCPEDEPCQSSVYVSCSCGRIRQAVQCGKSTSRPNGTSRLQPKCTSECGIAQRNARLADALGIKTDGRSNPGSEATYNEDLVGFARTNMKFLGLVESAFAEFVTSPKKTQVLPHMPPDRRKFVHDLAHVYRLDTQMVDQEPHRSVQIIRRVDTRIPHPLLSAHIASLTASAPTLGKLGNLRGGTVASPSWRKPSTGATSSHPSIAAPTATTPSSSTRGWTSVVARSTPPPNVRPTPPPASGNPSRTGTPDRTSRTTTSSSNVVPVAPSVPPSEPVDVPDDWEDDA